MDLLERRVHAKRSADDGSALVMVEKRARTLDDVLMQSGERELVELLEASPQLGCGVYGQAIGLLGPKGNMVAVAKITGCRTESTGDLRSPFRAEQCEPRILAHLWNVCSSATPHIVAPYGTHRIVNAATHKQRTDKSNANLRSSGVFFMEPASGANMSEVFKAQPKNDTCAFDKLALALLFQIGYTLECIYARHPAFRHNDLSCQNVLMNKTSGCDGPTVYEVHGVRYAIPDVGYQALMSDFDFACISGEGFDNYKTLEMEWDQPSYNISTRADQKADFFYLCNDVYHTYDAKMSRELHYALLRVFGGRTVMAHNPNLIESYHLLPAHAHRVPRVRDALASELFACFRVNETTTTVHFTCPPPQAGAPVPPLVQAGERRLCPMVFRDTIHNVSSAYLAQCPGGRSFDPPTEYMAQFFYDRNHIEEALDDVYSGRAMDGDAKVFKLDMSVRAQCLAHTRTVAEAVLVAHPMPLRWWFAVVTCAFVDAVRDFNAFNPQYQCMTMCGWCAYWRRLGHVSYDEKQLLQFALQWTWHRACACIPRR
jgi:hypothetical protein